MIKMIFFFSFLLSLHKHCLGPENELHDDIKGDALDIMGAWGAGPRTGNAQAEFSRMPRRQPGAEGELPPGGAKAQEAGDSTGLPHWKE